MQQPLILAGIALVLGSIPPASAQTRLATSDWPLTTPAAAKVNASVLDSISAEIARGDYGNVDRMLVIRSGRIVLDASFPRDYGAIYGDSAKAPNALNAGDLTGPYNYFSSWWHPYYRRGDLHTLQSVTKTITSVIIGVAITRGEFPSIDRPVLSFFDTGKVANIDERKRRMTIKHLLTMTGGFEWNENLPYIDPRNNAVVMEASQDWVAYTINLPMAREPGTVFNYSSGESQLLAHIFRQATGIDIEEYAAQHLFTPLGIEPWYWKRTPTGLVDTEGGLYLEARDLAKIWQLFLDDGVWKGTRVVSSDWVKQSVTPAVRVSTRAGAPQYGYKWWLYQNPVDSTRLVWGGSGFGGQFPLAFPEHDLVVVFNGWNILPGGKSLPVGRIAQRLLAATR